MIRIHTRTISTEMIQNQSFWNRSFNQQVSKTMNNHELIFDPKLTVSATIRVTRPEPTRTGLLDLDPETIHRRTTSRNPSAFLYLYVCKTFPLDSRISVSKRAPFGDSAFRSIFLLQSTSLQPLFSSSPNRSENFVCKCSLYERRKK